MLKFAGRFLSAENPPFRVFSIKIGRRDHCPAAHRP